MHKQSFNRVTFSLLASPIALICCAMALGLQTQAAQCNGTEYLEANSRNNLQSESEQQPWVKKDSPWKMLKTGVDASLRGLDVVDNNIIWASGTGGRVLRSIDGGESWDRFKIPNAKELDFRDIEAFDDKTAIVISAGTPARIYKTVDGGKSWNKVFEHQSDKAFFDAISFWDPQYGIAMSDPIDDRVLLVGTNDGGSTWFEVPSANRPKVIPGEGGFAASGTNMAILEDATCLIALGAAKENESFATSRIVRSIDHGKTWEVVSAPIRRSAAGGIFSLAFAGQHGIAVGGDYLKPNLADSNIAITNDGGKTWIKPTGKPPRGYRSGVAISSLGEKHLAITVGTTGTDVSYDAGKTWLPASDEAFHAVQFSPDGSLVFASGADGKIGMAKRSSFENIRRK